MVPNDKGALRLPVDGSILPGMSQPYGECSEPPTPELDALIEKYAYLGYLRHQKALRLALHVDDYQTLLRGGTVPLERMDPEWVRRYGLRA